MNHIPYDLTLDCLRAHRARQIKRQLAWSCVITAALLLSISMGILIAAQSDLILAALSGLILLAGLQGARYLLTHH